MSQQIIDMFKKHIKDDRKNDAIRLIEQVSHSLDLYDDDLVDYYNEYLKEDKFFWHIKPERKQGKKVIPVKIVMSDGEYIVNEVLSAIEYMIQVWTGNKQFTTMYERHAYKSITQFAIEKKISQEKLIDSWINGHTNEFKLYESGIVEIQDQQNTISLINELLSDFTWLKLESKIFKFYKTNRVALMRKLIIDDFIGEDNKPLELMRYGIMNWFADKDAIRQKIIDYYNNKTYNNQVDEFVNKMKGGMK